MTFPNCWGTLMAAGGLAFLAGVASAQDDAEGQRAAKEPNAEEIKVIAGRAEEMLREVRPVEIKRTERGPWEVMEQADGTVRWGNFFRLNEIAALVSVRQPGEESEFDPLRQDVCYFVWRKGRWEFQQFLDNARELEIHYRKDYPSVFLQGAFQTGRYEGECVSWYLDERTGKLERTHFEDWGPFYLKGDYLILERGFERLSHDETKWIYRYKDGEKGALLARFHTRDDGSFDVTFRDPATGPWRSWIFHQDHEEESRLTVTVQEEKKVEEGKANEEEGLPAKKGEIKDEADSSQVFALLTGLDPALLERGWADKLPARPPLKLSPMEVSGEAEIVKRLTVPLAQNLEEDKRQRVLGALRDIVPGAKVEDSTTIVSGDIRGVWGRIFGGPQVEALVALGMTKEGESGEDAELYLLQWDGAWKLGQRVGLVSSNADFEGKVDWKIRRNGSTPVSYVLSKEDPNAFGGYLSWRYDAVTQKLVPTGWPTQGRPSLSGDTITFLSRDQSEVGGPFVTEVFHYDGKVGARLGAIRQHFAGGLLRDTITVRDEGLGKDVTWRVWKMAPGYKPEADVYALCRDEEGGKKEFHEDATVEFDWGRDDLGEGSAAEFIWWRLTGASANAFEGRWDEDEKRPQRWPVSVKVSGLPEAVERFTWPRGG